MYRPIFAQTTNQILELLGMPPGGDLDITDHVEDWSLEPEVRFVLAKVVQHLKPSSYLEVGAYKGETFTTISSKLPSGARAYAIEPNPELSRCVEAKVSELSSSQCATVIGRTSREAFGEWGRELLDLILIDGSHAYPDVLFDISAWSTLLSAEGIMVIHDTVTRLERRFPQDYIVNPWDFEIIDIVGLKQRLSRHAWEGVAFLKWTDAAKPKVLSRML